MLKRQVTSILTRAKISAIALPMNMIRYVSSLKTAACSSLKTPVGPSVLDLNLTLRATPLVCVLQNTIRIQDVIAST